MSLPCVVASSNGPVTAGSAPAKVEWTIGWCMSARRNARHYERLPQHSETHLNWALITVMTKRLTRNGSRTSRWTKKPSSTC